MLLDPDFLNEIRVSTIDIREVLIVWKITCPGPFLIMSNSSTFIYLRIPFISSDFPCITNKLIITYQRCLAKCATDRLLMYDL